MMMTFTLSDISNTSRTLKESLQDKDPSEESLLEMLVVTISIFFLKLVEVFTSVLSRGF